MSSQVASPNTEAAILSRMIQARDRIGPEVAEYLLSIEFEADDIDRMNALAERAQEGNLTVEETAELDSYLHVGSLLSIMQSKARRLLNSEIATSRRR
jgi:DNA-binding FadR family transcriptional regulator